MFEALREGRNGGTRFDRLRHGIRTSPACGAAGPLRSDGTLGARAVRSRNLPRLRAALDALKCHKSEIMDIFLEIPGAAGHSQSGVGEGACAGQGAPSSAQWFRLETTIDRLPGAAENGLDCHRIVANLVVTAL